MKKIITNLLFISIIACCFIGCEKKHAVWVYYDETHGSDPWGSADMEESIKVKNIEKYLKGKGIKVFEVKVVLDDLDIGPIVNFAMHSKNGTRIHCKVNENDLNKMLEEKFYRDRGKVSKIETQEGGEK